MQFLRFLSILVIIGLFTSSLYAQLDSVWHQGPSSNFVLSGSIQTTDNFGDSFDPPGNEIKSTPFMVAPPLQENYLENNGSPLAEYVYIEGEIRKPGRYSGQGQEFGNYRGRRNFIRWRRDLL